MKTLDGGWVRLTGAALDARDDLTRLLPGIDAELRQREDALLQEVRDAIVKSVCRLRAAVKHPR